MKKICSKCKKSKKLNDFDKKGIGKKGQLLLSSHCKECRREYVKDHYDRNVHKYIEKAKRNGLKAKKLYDDYKRKLNCVDCGMSFYNHPYLCDFHHKDKNKEFSIGSIRGSANKFKSEIKKCIPLCANCHRIRHHSK